MGIQSTQSIYRPKDFNIMWGLSAQAIANEALVLGLANRSADPQTIVRDFWLNAPTGTGFYMYWASPVSAGQVQFFDVESQFTGGWDGANDNPYEIYGPITLNITTPSGLVVPYYVYRSDYSELGNVHWQTSAAV